MAMQNSASASCSSSGTVPVSSEATPKRTFLGRLSSRLAGVAGRGIQGASSAAAAGPEGVERQFMPDPAFLDGGGEGRWRQCLTAGICVGGVVLVFVVVILGMMFGGKMRWAKAQGRQGLPRLDGGWANDSVTLDGPDRERPLLNLPDAPQFNSTALDVTKFSTYGDGHDVTKFSTYGDDATISTSHWENNTSNEGTLEDTHKFSTTPALEIDGLNHTSDADNGTLGGGGGDPDALSTNLASATEISTTETLNATDTETGNATTEHNVACTPVEARLCASLAGGNTSGTPRTKAFAWNTAQQKCAQVSSDTYCARTPAASSFFRDVKECRDRCMTKGQSAAAPVTEMGAQESNPESETTIESVQTTAGESEGATTLEATTLEATTLEATTLKATTLEASVIPSVAAAESCVGVDPDSVDVSPCRGEDLRYPVYFDGTACSEEHEHGKCRYHGLGSSFETLEECRKACLGDEGKTSGDDAAAENSCKATEPTFECSDDLKKFSASFDADAGTCSALQVCLEGGYDTLEECNESCGAGAAGA